MEPERAAHQPADAARCELPRRVLERRYELPVPAHAQQAAADLGAGILGVAAGEGRETPAGLHLGEQTLRLVFLLLRGRRRGARRHRDEDVLEQPDVSGAVGGVDLRGRERATPGHEPIVEAVPAQLRDGRPHRLRERHRVVEALPRCQRLAEERVVDPDVR